MLPTVGPARAMAYAVVMALAAYANSVGNGFAYDDTSVVERNPVVTEGRWGEVPLGRYWPEATRGSGLYRPLTVASFTAEWALFDGKPAGFHAVSVAAHAAVSVLVVLLLLRWVGPVPAAVGGVVFAVHPVHVEAVANVVGRAEVYAAAAVLAAALLYLAGSTWRGWRRGARLAGVALLYGAGLASKEIAVTLPALLVLVEAYRGGQAPLLRRLGREAALYAGLAAVLGGYLVVRWSVLGTLAGDVPAPALRELGTSERVLTALQVWPQYLRLMVFPATLSADYAPGVLRVATGPSAGVVLGALVLAAWIGGAAALARRAPAIGLGLAWFAVAVLPVSNLLFPTGILLAERTLYLPSVGAALAAAGVVAALPAHLSRARSLLLAGAGALLLLAALGRTVSRNPTWMSSYTVLNTLALEHPESYLALRARAGGLARVGRVDEAAASYEAAVALAPGHYGLLTEAGGFLARRRLDQRAEELLRAAIRVTPDQPTAYRLLSEMLIRQGRGREGHGVALQGLAAAGPDRELWGLVAESYILKGDLPASLRARDAALGLEPGSAHDWRRRAYTLEVMGRLDEAARAWAEAARLDGTTRPQAPNPRGEVP